MNAAFSTWCLASMCVVPGVSAAPRQAAAQSRAAAAAHASPDLTAELAKEMSATPEQAAGAAGAIFGVAKSRLKPADFSKVSAAVPGMAALLGAAPPPAGRGNALDQLAGSAGGLASAASAFSKLGLSPEMASKAVPVIVGFVTKSGGASVGNLLAGVLK
jgi:hypothetical protein